MKNKELQIIETMNQLVKANLNYKQDKGLEFNDNEFNYKINIELGGLLILKKGDLVAKTKTISIESYKLGNTKDMVIACKKMINFGYDNLRTGTKARNNIIYTLEESYKELKLIYKALKVLELFERYVKNIENYKKEKMEILKAFKK